MADIIVKDYFVETQQLKEISSPGSEHKNIRRRVYDALNVLMAMDVISKDKKDINWQGLPKGAGTGSSGSKQQNMSARSRALIELERMEREKEKHSKDVKKKRLYLQQLLQQQVCYRNLVKHNEQHDEVTEARGKAKAQTQSSSLKRKAAGSDRAGAGDDNSSSSFEKTLNKKGKLTTAKTGNDDESNQSLERIALPFIVINTSNQTMVGCKFGPDRTEASFNFSKPFEINDDNEILKMLGL